LKTRKKGPAGRSRYQDEGIPVVTSDKMISKYKVKTIWK